MKTTETLTIVVLALGVMVYQAKVSEAATPMGTAFTYKGRLMDAGQPLSGFYDFQFRLFDDPDLTLGVQVGSTIDVGELDIIDGHITMDLDFGSGVFNGDARWLEIGVRPGLMEDPEAYTVLLPRVELKPVPYAMHTRGIFLDDHYPENIFVGIDAGKSNITGNTNTFVGCRAGVQNTSGSHNTFLGRRAGFSNTEGDTNTFLGTSAGRNNTTGGYNTLLGADAGRNNTTGEYNTFIGECAGYHNINGNQNTFLGDCAGFYTNGDRNTFVGIFTGCENSTGSGNVFIGYKAGYNETGSDRLYIANGPSDAETLIYGDFSTGNVGIGTTSPNPEYILHVECDDLHPLWRYVHAVYGKVAGLGSGVHGEGNIGVYGKTEKHIGVYGRADGEGTEGVVGYAYGSDSRGVTARGDLYDFYAAGPGTNYGALSSVRWKNNIRLIDEPLEKVLRLRGVYFDWDAQHGGHHDLGMIAEEVGQVLPEIVEYEEDGKYTSGMDYSKLTPLLVEAVKALKIEVSELQIQNAEKDGVIDTLKQQNDNLEDRLSMLESSIATITVKLTGGGK